jgi:hypothetical protein
MKQKQNVTVKQTTQTTKPNVLGREAVVAAITCGAAPLVAVELGTPSTAHVGRKELHPAW